MKITLDRCLLIYYSLIVLYQHIVQQSTPVYYNIYEIPMVKKNITMTTTRIYRYKVTRVFSSSK